MWCGKLRVTVWFVNRHLTVCVMWKTSGHHVWCGKLRVTVWFVNRHCVYCGKLTELCDLSTDIWDCVWCGKLAVTVWFVNKHSVYCEKLTELCKSSTDILCDVENVLNCVISQQTFEIVCDVENLRSPCDSSTDIWDCVWCGKLTVENLSSPCDSSTNIWDSVWCGKLAVTVWFVNRRLRFCVMWKTYGHRVIRQQTLCVICKTCWHCGD